MKKTIVLILFTALFFSGAVFCSRGGTSFGVERIPTPDDFLRTDESGEPTALVTPIVTFERRRDGESIGERDGEGAGTGDGELRVDLIAAFHFADAAYYERINRLFHRYDVVLVELVVPKGTTLTHVASAPRSASGRVSAVSALERFQKGAGRFLGLVNQLDAIDYAAPNLVLADIDAETLFERIAESGELEDFFFDLCFEMFGGKGGKGAKGEKEDGTNAADGGDFVEGAAGGIAKGEMIERGRESQEGRETAMTPKGAKGAKVGVWSLLFARDRRLELRRVAAVELTRGLASEPLFETSLIRERNRIALDALRNQIALGRRKIGIFYGAAHLPDMADRLEVDFGMTPISIEWLTAWDLNAD